MQILCKLESRAHIFPIFLCRATFMLLDSLKRDTQHMKSSSDRKPRTAATAATVLVSSEIKIQRVRGYPRVSFESKTRCRRLIITDQITK